MFDHSFFDIIPAVLKVTNNGVNHLSPLCIVEHVSEQGSWLLVVSVGMSVGVSSCLACHWDLVMLEFSLLDWSIQRVWFIVGSFLCMDSSSSISLVVSNSCSVGAVDWDLIVVCAQSVSMGIIVREKSTLEHFVVGWFDTWDQISWSESRLLCFSEVVLGVLVQHQLSNLDKGIVTVWPNFGDVEHVESVVFSFLNGHNLNIVCPRWEVTFLNAVIQIRSGEIFVLKSHLS